MKKNNKGFTLVELLAVMIVLVLIILMAYNIIKKNVDDTLDNTVRANAGIYIKGVNGLISEKSITDASYDIGFYTISEIDELGLKISGDKPTSGYIVVMKAEVYQSCLQYDDYYIEYINGGLGNVIKGTCPEIETNKTFEYSGDVESFDVIVPGNYLIEVWGAEGAASGGAGGKGGYSKGIVTLNLGDVLYVTVGGAGSGKTGGFNGGGNGSATCSTGSSYKDGGGGGGASSVALNENYGELKNYSTHLESILIVAGGGGGGAYISNNYSGGAGGGLTGSDGTGVRYSTQGASQTSGYQFGLGQNGGPCGGTWGESGRGGAGGGWYGGSASQIGGYGVSGGAGGSGYVNPLLEDASMTNGERSGNGLVVITRVD
jgi:prepilin-type N-terminal cleavage/methylation domain-containing protein